jgi:hypothetical protein
MQSDVEKLLDEYKQQRVEADGDYTQVKDVYALVGEQYTDSQVAAQLGALVREYEHFLKCLENEWHNISTKFKSLMLLLGECNTLSDKEILMLQIEKHRQTWESELEENDKVMVRLNGVFLAIKQYFELSDSDAKLTIAKPSKMGFFAPTYSQSLFLAIPEREVAPT